MSLAIKRRHSKKNILFFSAILYLILFALVLLFSYGFNGKRLLINSTSSLPGYLYLLNENNKTLSKGNVVALNVPKNTFVKNSHFLKQIWGVPGDSVTFDKYGNFSINGELKGRAKTVTSYTRLPLTHANPGVIKPHYYFVATPHSSSFDSRYIYIGNIHEKDIIGDATLIF